MVLPPLWMGEPADANFEAIEECEIQAVEQVAEPDAMRGTEERAASGAPRTVTDMDPVTQMLVFVRELGRKRSMVTEMALDPAQPPTVVAVAVKDAGTDAASLQDKDDCEAQFDACALERPMDPRGVPAAMAAPKTVTTTEPVPPPFVGDIELGTGALQVTASVAVPVRWNAEVTVTNCDFPAARLSLQLTEESDLHLAP